MSDCMTDCMTDCITDCCCSPSPTQRIPYTVYRTVCNRFDIISICGFSSRHAPPTYSRWPMMSQLEAMQSYCAQFANQQTSQVLTTHFTAPYSRSLMISLLYPSRNNQCSRQLLESGAVKCVVSTSEVCWLANCAQ